MVTALVFAAAVAMAPAKTFEFSGSYVEGCSCNGPCPCELTGVKMGCQGIGIFNVQKGAYKGKDMSGCRFAYATQPGEWIEFYVDAPNATKRATCVAFITQYLGPFGKITGTHDAKIKLTVLNNKQYARVDDGKVMGLESSTVYGLDKKNPLMYSNMNDAIHPIVMQGKVSKCFYNNGDKSFKLEGTNAYFNRNIASSQ